MEKKARKVFDLNEQKAKDVLSAIKAMVPVISLIREWGKVEQEYKQIVENNKRLSKEIDSIEFVCKISYSDGNLKETLSKILEEKSAKYKESSKKEKELAIICEDMESEVVDYKIYAKLFSWIDTNVLKETLQLNSFEDEEEFLAMLMLLLNADKVRVLSSLEHKEECFKKRKYMNAIVDHTGWNYMLRKLKANEL